MKGGCPMPKKNSEKRKFERIPVQSIVFYRIEKDEGDKKVMNLMTSQTPLSVDLSEGGMKILAMQDIPKGAKMKILLTFYNDRVPIKLDGRVMWSEKADTPAGTEFNVGIQFVGISDTRKKIIARQLSLNKGA
jgi:hypothetical protein